MSAEAAGGTAGGGGGEGTTETFKPTDEFTHAVEPISLAGHKLELKAGPVDMSISTAVVYLWIAAFLVAVVCIGVARVSKILPSRKQVAFESIYELVRDKLVGAVMHGDTAKRWFPFILALFLFILFSNLIGLVPIFLGFERFGVPSFRTYAATSNINVTAALALLTFLFTHVSGIRANGPFTYFKNWMPGSAPAALKPVLFIIHAVSELFRLLSLAVRLFANMLAGHIMILVFYALIFMLPSIVMIVALSWLIELGVVAISGFEVFVAVIQAYIFAILSAVYIGGAIHQEH